jgi:hypothetical protein
MGSKRTLGRLVGGEWIHLAQDSYRWRAVVNGVMNLQVLAPWNQSQTNQIQITVRKHRRSIIVIVIPTTNIYNPICHVCNHKQWLCFVNIVLFSSASIKDTFYQLIA